MYNMVRKESRNTVKSIQRKVAVSCKKNPKSFWQYIKSKTSMSPVINDLRVYDSSNVLHLITDDQGKAEAFSDHFSKLYTIESDEPFTTLPCIMSKNSMGDIIFNEGDVMHQLAKLKINKSPGPDLLHPMVLFELRDVLVEPFTVLFNQPMRQSAA